MLDIVIERIACADPLNDQSCAGVEYRGEARLLVPVIVSIGVSEPGTDGFRDHGCRIQHDSYHG